MSAPKRVKKRLSLVSLKSKEQEQLHQASLEIISEVGVRVCAEEARQLLKAAGAFMEQDRVKIPHFLVEAALKSAPSELTIYDREGAPFLQLEEDNIYFGPGSDTPYVIDLHTGQRRFSVKADTVEAVIVADALAEIDFVMSMARASDVKPERACRHHFETMICHTKKPIIFDASSKEALTDMIAMASLAAGGKIKLQEMPFIIHYTEPTSPLIHSRPALEKLLLCAAEKIPLVYAPAVMCGATGPVTTAGSVALAVAESLSGLVIHQLKAPGSPFIFGGGTPPLNMASAICTYGDPQGNLGLVSMVEMARYYRLPSFSTAGCTDAQLFDQQAALEAGLNLLIVALAGGNLIHDLGYMGAGLITSLPYLVLCNEAAAAVRFMIRGVEVNPERIALDVIHKVGPGGQFMTEQHTFDNFRSEMHFTSLLNRNIYENWIAAGSKSAGESAAELAREILKWHEIPRLPEAVEAGIKAIASG